MSEYGSVIKQIRTGKGISQSFFEKRILLSQSQLSRIERGNSEPTFKDVINILDILHVPIEEFLYISNNYSHNCSWKVIRDVQEALNTNDVNTLKTLKEKIYEKYLISNDFMYHHYFCICKAHILRMEDKNEEISEIIKPVKEYLLKVDDWCTYELTLLKYILFFLVKQFVERISNGIFRSIEKYKEMETGYQIFTSFISALAFYFLKNRDFQKSLLLCNQVLNSHTPKSVMFDVIELSFIKGIAIYMSGSKQYGARLIRENFSVLVNTNYSSSLDKFKKVLNEFGMDAINKKMNPNDESA